METGADRRHGRRLAVCGHPESRVRATLDARLLDLSHTGARIEHNNLLRPGFVCTLEFPRALANLVLSVQVMRSVVVGSEVAASGERVLRYESGLAFVKLGPEQQKLLDQVLERLEMEPGLGEGRLLL
jgi:hypothetical protein